MHYVWLYNIANSDIFNNSTLNLSYLYLYLFLTNPVHFPRIIYLLVIPSSELFPLSRLLLGSLLYNISDFYHHHIMPFLKVHLYIVHKNHENNECRAIKTLNHLPQPHVLPWYGHCFLCVCFCLRQIKHQ